MPETRIGLFGIGLDSYWPQFKGHIADRIEKLGRLLNMQTIRVC